MKRPLVARGHLGKDRGERVERPSIARRIEGAGRRTRSTKNPGRRSALEATVVQRVRMRQRHRVDEELAKRLGLLVVRAQVDLARGSSAQ